MQDFLESVDDEFDLNDLFNLQAVMTNLENTMEKYKADKITRLMRELFKKYQIEIVQPNLDYIVNKFYTAYERLQKEMKNQEE